MSHRILIVCTANVCRSPMTAALLAEACQGRNLEMQVVSAGLTDVTLDVDPVAMNLMAERGLDLSGHLPHRVTSDDLVDTDLVIAMTREHVRILVADHGMALARTFTLKELARRIDERPGGTLADVHEGRTAADLLGQSDDDDIADPYRRTSDRYTACVNEIDHSLAAVVAGLEAGLLAGDSE